MSARHRTVQEIAFLSRIGAWATTGLLRKTLLRRYVKAARQRHDWGAIDPVAVIAHANEQLACIRPVRRLPPPPRRSDPPELFIKKADAFFGALPNFKQELETATQVISNLIPKATEKKTPAEAGVKRGTADGSEAPMTRPHLYRRTRTTK
jgi:hypothetical protein